MSPPGAWRAGAVLLLSSWLAAEARDRTAPVRSKVTDERAEDYVEPVLPRARVMLKAADGAVHEVQVEVAATPLSRSRGLMWRKELTVGHGMLFVFAEEEEQTFWMRNTLIPLDMIFIDSERRIVGIVENAEPRSFKRRGVGVPGLYVLEVPGGQARAMGLKTGGGVRFEGLEHVRVVP